MNLENSKHKKEYYYGNRIIMAIYWKTYPNF